MNLQFEQPKAIANWKKTTVRPQDTWTKAARTLTVHVFEWGPTKFEMHEFM